MSPISKNSFDTSDEAFFAQLVEKNTAWFVDSARRLSFREGRTFYSTLVSEMMAHQTRVETFLPYFENWMNLFPTLESLAEASTERVYAAWAGLGYYRRARYLHEIAKRIVQEGKIPRTQEELLSFPGIGDYTAHVILSLVYEDYTPVIDTNVSRVLIRLLGNNFSTPELKTILAEKMIPLAKEKNIPSSVFSQSWMELGALICKHQNPACLFCPHQYSCRAFLEKKIEQLPPKVEKKWKTLEESVGILWANHSPVENDHVLLWKNTKRKWNTHLFDFPSLEELEAHSQEKLSMEYIGSIDYTITQHKIHRKIYVLAPLDLTLPEEIITTSSQNKEGWSSPAKKTFALWQKYLKNI